MHRIDKPTAAPGNQFTEGDPLVPTPATQVSADWLNAVQEEVANVIEGTGAALNKPTNTQLRTAINLMISNAVATPTAMSFFFANF